MERHSAVTDEWDIWQEMGKKVVTVLALLAGGKARGNECSLINVEQLWCYIFGFVTVEQHFHIELFFML